MVGNSLLLISLRYTRISSAHLEVSKELYLSKKASGERGDEILIKCQTKLNIQYSDERKSFCSAARRTCMHRKGAFNKGYTGLHFCTVRTQPSCTASRWQLMKSLYGTVVSQLLPDETSIQLEGGRATQ